LDPVLLGRFHAYQFIAVPSKFAKLTEVFRRYKRTSDKIEFIEIRYPFGIFLVSLLTFDSLDIFGVCKADFNIRFKIIVDRNPVLAGGLHADMLAAVFKQPVMEEFEITIDGGE